MNQSKAIGFWEDICPTLEDDDFRRYFRMNAATLKSLCTFLRPKRCAYQGGREEVAPLKAVAMTLTFLGSQLPYKQLSGFFRVSEACLIHTTEYVMKLLNEKSNVVIKWPEKNDFACIAGEFNNKRWRCFPNVIGCIDGCHIRIAAKKMREAHIITSKDFTAFTFKPFVFMTESSLTFLLGEFYVNLFRILVTIFLSQNR